MSPPSCHAPCPGGARGWLLPAGFFTFLDAPRAGGCKGLGWGDLGEHRGGLRQLLDDGGRLSWHLEQQGKVQKSGLVSGSSPSCGSSWHLPRLQENSGILLEKLWRLWVPGQTVMGLGKELTGQAGV